MISAREWLEQKRMATLRVVDLRLFQLTYSSDDKHSYRKNQNWNIAAPDIESAILAFYDYIEEQPEDVRPKNLKIWSVSHRGGVNLIADG